MKFSKYTIKAVTPVMALFQKQHRLLFKQGYDNLRSTRGESAASADTTRSERCFHRNQSAVCASHNVPSDTQIISYIIILSKTINNLRKSFSLSSTLNCRIYPLHFPTKRLKPFILYYIISEFK